MLVPRTRPAPLIESQRWPGIFRFVMNAAAAKPRRVEIALRQTGVVAGARPPEIAGTQKNRTRKRQRQQGICASEHFNSRIGANAPEGSCVLHFSKSAMHRARVLTAGDSVRSFDDPSCCEASRTSFGQPKYCIRRYKSGKKKIPSSISARVACTSPLYDR